MILGLLADGCVHLSGIRLLAPHLTEVNHRNVLLEASHKSKRQIEEIAARLQARPDVPATVRKLPQVPPRMLQPNRQPMAHQSAPSEIVQTAIQPLAPTRTRVDPLAPGRYKVQFTVTRDTYEKLRRVQDLLRHQVPNGDPAAIFDRALTLLLEKLEKQKTAATARPHRSEPVAKNSRHVPAAIRRMVWARDDGRCRFEGAAGRCTETGYSSFITSSRMLRVAPRPPRTWSFAVPPTIGMRRNSTLACLSENCSRTGRSREWG